MAVKDEDLSCVSSPCFLPDPAFLTDVGALSVCYSSSRVRAPECTQLEAPGFKAGDYSDVWQYQVIQM